MSTLRRILSSRKRRVRKKHHTGEFTRLGFHYSVHFPKGSVPDPDVVFERVIEQIEIQGLSMGGGMNLIRFIERHADGSTVEKPTYSIFGYVTREDRSSCTHADFEALQRAVRGAFPFLGLQSVCELTDVWSTCPCESPHEAFIHRQLRT